MDARMVSANIHDLWHHLPVPSITERPKKTTMGEAQDPIQNANWMHFGQIGTCACTAFTVFWRLLPLLSKTLKFYTNFSAFRLFAHLLHTSTLETNHRFTLLHS